MVRKQTRLGGFFIVCEKTILFQSTEQRVGEIAKNQLPGRRNKNCAYGGIQSEFMRKTLQYLAERGQQPFRSVLMNGLLFSVGRLPGRPLAAALKE